MTDPTSVLGEGVSGSEDAVPPLRGWPMVDPTFDSLRADSHFQQIVTGS